GRHTHPPTLVSEQLYREPQAQRWKLRIGRYGGRLLALCADDPEQRAHPQPADGSLDGQDHLEPAGIPEVETGRGFGLRFAVVENQGRGRNAGQRWWPVLGWRGGHQFLDRS